MLAALALHLCVLLFGDREDVAKPLVFSVPCTAFDTAVQRGSAAGGHAIVTMTTNNYVREAQNWIANADTDTLQRTTIFVTPDVSLHNRRLLEPYAVSFDPPRRPKLCTLRNYAFYVKQYIMNEVLRRGASVLSFLTWYDLDALPLASYAQWLQRQPAIHSFSMIAQRGLSPTEVSKQYGSAICAGFFTLTPRALDFHTQFMQTARGLNCFPGAHPGFLSDQTALNTFIDEYDGFHFAPGLSYLGTPAYALNTPIDVSDGPKLRIGLLPYAEFPRGEPWPTPGAKGKGWRALKRHALVWHLCCHESGMRRDKVWRLADRLQAHDSVAPAIHVSVPVNTPNFLSNAFTITKQVYDGICIDERGNYVRSFSDDPSNCHTVPVNMTITIARPI